jgi:hypothetical protein
LEKGNKSGIFASFFIPIASEYAMAGTAGIAKASWKAAVSFSLRNMHGFFHDGIFSGRLLGAQELIEKGKH